MIQMSLSRLVQQHNISWKHELSLSHILEVELLMCGVGLYGPFVSSFGN